MTTTQQVHNVYFVDGALHVLKTHHQTDAGVCNLLKPASPSAK
jgi:hypothetical protein